MVNHVVGQEHRFARNMAGGSLDEYTATRDADFLGADPVAAWEAGARALDAAIDGLSGLDVVIGWRVPLPARDLLGPRVFEAAVQTWDLSRAVGFDDRLDPRLVSSALDALDRIRAFPDLAAFFAEPGGTLGPDTHPQTRLPALAGRPLAS